MLALMENIFPLFFKVLGAFMDRANIIIGPSCTGKYDLAEKLFPDYEVLSVGRMQREVERERGKDLFIILEAHEKIIEDYVQKIQDRKNAVMIHTLFKTQRRVEYIEAIRQVSDIPVDIYVMQPSNLQNIFQE